MTDEGSKNQIGEGGASSPPTTAKEPQGGQNNGSLRSHRGFPCLADTASRSTSKSAFAPALDDVLDEVSRRVDAAPRSSVSPPPTTTGTAIACRPAPAPSPPPTLGQAENGSSETRKLCHTTKAKGNSEFGAGVAGFAVSMVVAWYFLSPEDRGAHNQRYIIPLLFGFICFISGLFQMLLNMYLLEISEHLDTQTQRPQTLRMFSKYLSLLCSTLLVVTLVSPLILSGYKPYRYAGLAILVVLAAPLAVVRWYVGLKAEGGDEEAAYREHKEQLETAFKLLSAISNSAFSGLVALVVNYNITGGSGSTKSAVLVAIFFIFTTSIWGLLSMELRDKVLEINNQRLRRCIIQAMWLAIIIMHSLLACAVLAEVFAIVEFSIFAAFAPCVFAAAVYIYMEHWVGRVAHNRETTECQEVRLKWKAEKGIKITMWSFMAIIGIFGGFLHGKAESLRACIILLTSAFMSGFALTVVTINPDSASVGLAAATNVLDWTAVATFAAAIFALIIAMVLDIP